MTVLLSAPQVQVDYCKLPTPPAFAASSHKGKLQGRQTSEFGKFLKL